MKAVTKRKSSVVLTHQRFTLTPKNLSEAMEFAKIIANSGLVSKDFRGKPGDVLVAVQMGSDIGLPPMQAIQNIAVINGRPCLWGDALLAIVKAHVQFEYIKETEEKNIAVCKIKRRNQPEHVTTFSQEDAIRAGLANKQGPWRQYPRRMRQLRARGFAIRDTFPDALKGLQMAEEVRDYLGHQNDNHAISCDNTGAGNASKVANLLMSETESRISSAQLNELIEKHKISRNVIDTWLQKAKVQSIDDLPQELIKKAIQWINNKYETTINEINEPQADTYN